ncbi:MAG: transcriptional regulator [Acidianus sp.]|jgi:DNA-binding MarR family transcriptional regulator|nr:transcriptional regulator [Acidianus sp.]
MENLKELMEILSDPIFSSPIRVGILLALTGIKTITFSELQKNLGINKSTLSVNLKILENNGLIEIKTKFFKDRPREVIVITEKGKKLVEKYLEAILKYKEIIEENNNENIK